MSAVMVTTVVLIVLQLLILPIICDSAVIVIDENKGKNELPCLDDHPPCLSLSFAVSNIQVKSNTTIILQSQKVTITDKIEFANFNGITVYSISNSTIHCMPPASTHAASAGLVFKDCTEVNLTQVTITGCSVHTTLPHYGNKLRSGLIAFSNININFYQVTFDRNNGYGAVLVNNTGTVNISYSSFSNNYDIIKTGIDGGGGLVIWCSNNNNETGNYNLHKVIFTNNTHILPTNHHPLWYGSFSHYGGGLNIFLKSETKGWTFKLSNNTFKNNKGIDRGGLSVMIEGNCINNTIIIEKAQIVNNNATEMGRGGGLKIEIYGHLGFAPQNNTITVTDVIFRHNNALFGGGTSIFLGATNGDDRNKLVFKNCHWMDNVSPASSAIDIIPKASNHQTKSIFATEPLFEDCTISHNNPSAFYTNYTHFKGHGTFVTSKITIRFKGVNSFAYNTLTPLVVSSATVKVLDNSRMIFIGNSGGYGGAIALHGFSAIHYQKNIIFNFTNNKAHLLGGSVYASNIDLHYDFASHFCIFQANNLLNVSFYFDNNKSPNPSNEIFMTSLHPCSNYCQRRLSNINENPLTVNTCLGDFYFDSQQEYNVTTDVSMIILQTDHMDFIPGHSTVIPIKFYDDLNQEITNITTFTTEVENAPEIELFTSKNRITLKANPGTKGTLIITPLGYRGSFTKMPFTMSQCPPGFILDHNKICQCSHTLDRFHRYNNIFGCNTTSLSFYIKSKIWVGYINDDNKTDNSDNLYTGVCPYRYCYKNSKSYQKNRNEIKYISGLNISDQVCEKNRQGILCGQCKNGTTVYFHSKLLKCRSSKHCSPVIGILLYVVSELLPITVFFAVIIYFNISFTSGFAYSVIFMVQHIHLSLYFSESIVCNFCYVAITNSYNLFEFKFFNSHNTSFCLWETNNPLDIFAISYVSVLYAISLVVILVKVMNSCLIRRCNARESSIVQGMTAFLVLCYSRCADITFKILTIATLRGKGGIPYPKPVIFFNGEMTPFEGKHIIFAVPAILCIVIILIPTPLCLIIDQPMLKLESCVKILRRQKLWTKFRERYKPLLDAFQGCFKDNMRWFSGMFFVFRVVVLTAVNEFDKPGSSYTNLQFTYLCILTSIAICQPFIKGKHNLIAFLCIFNLLLINLATIQITETISYGDLERIPSLQMFQLILMYIPVAVVIGWIVVKAVGYIKTRKSINCCYKKIDENEDDVNISLIFDRKNDEDF
jgi:hypothetical protein